MLEFGRPKGFETLIMDNLRKNVKNDDLLIHLGDFCIGGDLLWHTFFHNNLPLTKKWLIRGNHDKKTNSWYLAHRWDFVGESIRDNLFGEKIVFSHIPIADDGTFTANIHGHFHNSDHRSREPELKALYTNKHQLIAIENTNYQPVLLNTLISKMNGQNKKQGLSNKIPSVPEGQIIQTKGEKDGKV